MFGVSLAGGGGTVQSGSARPEAKPSACLRSRHTERRRSALPLAAPGAGGSGHGEQQGPGSGDPDGGGATSLAPSTPRPSPSRMWGGGAAARCSSGRELPKWALGKLSAIWPGTRRPTRVPITAPCGAAPSAARNDQMPGLLR